MEVKKGAVFLMTKREQIVRCARSWLGTPYHHQESIKGVGCDCLGLLRGVWTEFYGEANPEEVPNYSPSWNDHRLDDPMLQIAKKYFKERPKHAEMQEGDVLMFRMRRGQAVKHCAIVSAQAKMIHAYNLHAVREDDITNWWLEKLAGVFRFKGVR